MSYKKQKPKVPHFDAQRHVAFEHIYALIGDKAWAAWRERQRQGKRHRMEPTMR